MVRKNKNELAKTNTDYVILLSIWWRWLYKIYIKREFVLVAIAVELIFLGNRLELAVEVKLGLVVRFKLGLVVGSKLGSSQNRLQEF